MDIIVSNQLITVTDFDGRVVTLSYFSGLTSEGSDRDLASITWPATTQFPSGKTVSFTYSRWTEDNNLDHNMLTMTDPSNNTYVTNTYGTTGGDYDRVTNQQWGDSNQNVTFQYLTGTQYGDYNLITDRNGNQMALGFNAFGLPRYKVEFPRGLRPNEPQGYITNYDYNAEGLMTRVKLPEGNCVVYEYDETNPDRFQQKNRISERHKADCNANDDDTIDLVTTWEYEPVYNQVVKIIEPRGNDSDFVPAIGQVNSDRYTTGVYL